MNQGFLPVFESLESRRLLSGTINPSPIITADLEAIKADIVKLNADRKQVATTLAGDRDAVKAAQRATDQAVAPLRAALAADMKKWRGVAQADMEAIKAVQKTWQPILMADRKAIWADQRDPVKLAADRIKLADDQAKMQAELAPLQGKLRKDNADAKTALDADRLALQKAIEANKSAIDAARKKFEADIAAGKKTIDADLAQLKADRLKLEQDRKAKG